MWEVPSQYLREIESRVLKIKRLMVLRWGRIVDKKRLDISVAYSHDLKRKKGVVLLGLPHNACSLTMSVVSLT
jgi:hypothetical protein